MDKRLTACFTGHREIRGDAAALEARVSQVAEELILQGYQNFCAGGARGFDALASKVILRLKEKYPFVRQSIQRKNNFSCLRLCSSVG